MVRVTRAAGGLKRSGGQRPQQLHQMRAPFDATQPQAHFTPPATANFYASQSLEIHRDITTGRVRARIGLRLGIVNQHVKINGKAYPHIMHGLTGLTRLAAMASRMDRGFGIYQMRFNIPQAVVAFVAFAFDGAGVDGCAGLMG